MNSRTHTRKPKMHLGLCAWVVLMGACTSSTSNSPPNANGGAAGTGGATGSGGVAQASSTATGGINSSGGVSGTGGAHTAGGASATGGTAASGSGGSTASGSGGSTTGYTLPPACPTHTPLSCPAVDSTKTFGSLSQADVSALCDCEIVAYGGYGTNQTCTCADGHMATNTNPASKAACIAAYKATAACTWVMSDYFKCMNLMQDPCNMMGMAVSLGDPSCAGGMNNSACTTGQ
jgi:hypothetical protein